MQKLVVKTIGTTLILVNFETTEACGYSLLPRSKRTENCLLETGFAASSEIPSASRFSTCESNVPS